MRQITINVPENQYFFFLALVENLGLEKAEEETVETEEEVLKDLEQGFREVRLI